MLLDAPLLLDALLPAGAATAAGATTTAAGATTTAAGATTTAAAAAASANAATAAYDRHTLFDYHVPGRRGCVVCLTVSLGGRKGWCCRCAGR